MRNKRTTFFLSLIFSLVLVSALADFVSDCATKATDARTKGTITVVGKDGWMFFAPELRHLSVGPFWGEKAAAVSKSTKPENADPLPPILDLNDQLKKLGVRLMVVPVPPKAVIYPDFVSEFGPAGGIPRVDGVLQEFYQLLEENGVSVVDLTPRFLENRFHSDGALFCKQDTHWSGNGCVLAAKTVAGEIRSAFSEPRLPLKTEWAEVEITGDLWKMANDPAIPKEQVRVRKVTTANSESIATDERSPVVLLGDSYDLVYHSGDDMFASGAGLADQLAFELGFAVDLVAVRGSGATPARINLLRRAQKNPGYWLGKKVVIWCFGAREFTESDGWRKVPIKP
jgi:hypothetical protein